MTFFGVVRFGKAQNHHRVEVVAHVVEDLSEAFAGVVVEVPDLPCLAVETLEVAVAQIVAECDELLDKGAGGGSLLGAQVFKDVFQPGKSVKQRLDALGRVDDFGEVFHADVLVVGAQHRRQGAADALFAVVQRGTTGRGEIAAVKVGADALHPPLDARFVVGEICPCQRRQVCVGRGFGGWGNQMGGENVEPVGLGWGGRQVLPDTLQRADGEPLAVAETKGRIGRLNDKADGGCEQGNKVADALGAENCGGGFGDKDGAVGGMFM